MLLSEDAYVPALRWRQAEYQALESRAIAL